MSGNDYERNMCQCCDNYRGYVCAEYREPSYGDLQANLAAAEVALVTARVVVDTAQFAKCYELERRLAAAKDECSRLGRCNEQLSLSHAAQINNFQAQLKAAEALLNTRAGKLLRKSKTFVVVAVDEPYFLHVYDLIRAHETKHGRWTDECQKAYRHAIAESFAIAAEREEGGVR